MPDNTPVPTQESANSGAYRDYFREARQHTPVAPPRHLWLLKILALVCAMLVVAGSLGPWMSYERVSETVPEAWTLYGLRITEGAVVMMLAVVAIVALLVVFFRPSADVAAWCACGALVVCAVTGLVDWFLLAPTQQNLDPGELGRIVRVEWGLKLVALAGAAGSLITFFVARGMNRY